MGRGFCFLQVTNRSTTRLAVFEIIPVLMVTNGPSALKYGKRPPGQREDATRQLECRVYIFKGVWEGTISLHLLQESLGRILCMLLRKAGFPGAPSLSLLHHSWEMGDERGSTSGFCETTTRKHGSLIRNPTKISCVGEQAGLRIIGGTLEFQPSLNLLRKR